MIDDLKNVDLIKKVGGKYKLTALIQRRVLEIMQGSRPLIENTEGKTTLEIVIQEILQNKIAAEYGKSDQPASDKPQILMAKEKANLEGVNVLLGVSGAVAVYKAVDLASKLTAGGAVVKTVMTENACQFVTPKSFEAVTNSRVYSSLWVASEEFNIGHINLTDWANIVAVVPATANIMGKMANGICDDLLSSILCVCWQKPILIAPAMNTNMWNNPAVQQNRKMLAGRGVEMIGPETGRLACGTEGVGRMAEPQDILKRIEQIASKIISEKGK